MKTNLFSRITLAGLLLSAAAASGAAMAQGTAPVNDKPAVQHVTQHRHAQHALHKTAHKAKHHKKVHQKTKAATPAQAPASSPAPVQAPAPVK